jgi:hypothetical protein
MGTKQYDSATDLLTFSRASGGTALSKISYGNELVTNGTFDSDLSGWTTNSASWDNGTLQVDYQQYNTYSKQLLTGLVVGKSYQVGYTVTSDTQGSGGSAFVAIFTSNSDYSSIAGSSYVRRVAGSYTFAFTATTPTVQLRLKKGGYTGVTTFDNVSVKEVLFDQADGTLQLWNHGNNVPRIEYDATGAVKGLLIEEARTNLLTYSNVFANSAWSKQNLTATANQATGPDGTVSATEIGITGTAGNSYSINSTASTTGTISYFAKQNTERFFLIVRGVYGAGDWAIFDLSNGTVSKSPTHNNSTAHITPMGNGWYRCVLQSDNYTTINAFSISGSGTDYNTPTSGTVYLYGAQMEAGAFPTSYIPTTSATATRARDLAEIPTSAFGYNNDKGSLVVDFLTPVADQFITLAYFNTSSYHHSRSLWKSNYALNGAGDYFKAQAHDTVAGQTTDQALTQQTQAGYTKLGLSYGDSEKAVRDGGTVISGDSRSPTPIRLHLGGRDDGYQSQCWIKSIQYYPRQLTDTQLQELTT